MKGIFSCFAESAKEFTKLAELGHHSIVHRNLDDYRGIFH